MKIDFDDNSYITVEKTEEKIVISISASHLNNPLAITVNTAELTKKQFNQLISDIITIKEE